MDPLDWGQNSLEKAQLFRVRSSDGNPICVETEILGISFSKRKSFKQKAAREEHRQLPTETRISF